MHELVSISIFHSSRRRNSHGHHCSPCCILADIDPATGKNWCSDCVKAEPYIEQFAKPLAIKKGIDLWTVVVGDRDTWKNPQNPLRTNPNIKLNGVPTLLLFKKGKGTIKLEEEMLMNQEFIEAFFEEL